MIDESLWRAERFRSYASGALPHEVDVVVIGGGIAGLTAAYLLKSSGERVAVFERERIGAGDTGNTSSHLTYVTDTPLSRLAEQFGAAAARLIWRAGELAIDVIESNVATGIDCRFRRVPGFLCAAFVGETDLKRERESLQRNAEFANRLGFPARFSERGPITGKPAVVYPDQAIFHPLEYLHGLGRAIDGDGSIVRERCEVGEVIDDPLAVIVGGETIACRDVVIATHVPMVGIRNLAAATLFQTKIYPYSSYVVGASFDDETLMPGLYNDTTDPYYFLRVQEWPTKRYAIFGGCDHKTGQEADTEARFRQLIDTLHRLIPSAKVERRWSGQVIETADGLPYIGRVTDHQYINTGDSGNGLTYGTLAGVMIRDAIMEIDNPWIPIFDPNRKPKSLDSLRQLVAENVDYPLYFVLDRLRRQDRSGVESVPRGSGKVIDLDGGRVAVHRRDDGEVVKVSAVCTHMGCLVRWNDAERTWDCPCHGSRFTPEGLVLAGPAEAPLEKVD